MQNNYMVSEGYKKPEILVFAGPNGSGKSTITRLANIIEPYINADDIKRSSLCSDIEAAQMADTMRNELIDKKQSFTFETVLSTDRNLKIPELIDICDICHIYDNSDKPFRIFKKSKLIISYWENQFWDKDKIHKLVNQ